MGDFVVVVVVLLTFNVQASKLRHLHLHSLLLLEPWNQSLPGAANTSGPGFRVSGSSASFQKIWCRRRRSGSLESYLCLICSERGQPGSQP